jgi:hypothetical protein
MSIPARLIISAITILTVLIGPERVDGILLFICVADGLGALAIGFVLGFTGKVLGGEKR